MTLFADDPRVHVFRHMTERRNFTNLVEIFDFAAGRGRIR